jgi:type IV pilus assembly protein PilB
MKLDQQKIVDILLKQNYISQDDLVKAKSLGQKESVIDYLLAQHIITKDLEGQAIAEYYDMPYADLNSNQPSQKQVLKIPEEIARKYRLVLFKINEQGLIVTTDQPELSVLKEVLPKLFPGKKINLNYSLSADIDDVFIYYRKSLATRFSKIIENKQRIAPEIVEEMVEDALSYRASDIHFEPEETEVIIRFRVDGVLQEAGRIPKEYYENILNRIKVQAHLRTDEHFAAQDGSIRLVKNGLNVDLRVSIIPTLDGEKIVARVLSQYIGQLNLSDLGLDSDYEDQLLRVAKKPFGMILVVGPTGSGKTTTLYALLKLLNKPDINITTIEDPVEYKINGLNQIQVNNATNLTFAKGLRSIVRQDPDIILVGEIRDQETAEIAVNSALTGHLLLSTFHANDAATAIPRLLDMGIEPFLLSSTLNLIIAPLLLYASQ